MSTELFDLSGKIALITGASRGIGEAIARLLAEQGAHVIVSSRKQEGCQVVADAITADGGSAEALFSNDEIYQAAMAQIPMGRHAEPREMAGTVLYLVSDASSYTTGECIVVDGGLTI